jgi:hypothetical protein
VLALSKMATMVPSSKAGGDSTGAGLVRSCAAGEMTLAARAETPREH